MADTPNVRFKGFTDDWEEHKLGVLSSSLEYGLNAAAKEFDGKNKYIRITDIDDSSHEFVMDGVTSPDIDLSTVDDYKLLLGDILFARTGASVGKSYIYKDSDGLVYFAGFLIRARIKKEYNPEFVFQNTLTTDYKKYITITSQRSGQPGVNAQEYSEYKIMIPERDEQDKISAFLRNIDYLITFHQRKCDEVKQLKKFMLQKMFPKSGELIPEIRFAGFTDDWEQCKLGEVTAKIGSGKTPLGGKAAYVNSGIALIRSQNINGDKVDLSDVVFIDDKTNSSMENSQVYRNDVLLNITGASIGRSAVYKEFESANVNQHVCIIRPIEGYSSEFIQLNLASDNGQKQIESGQAGGGREGLNFQQIGKMKFHFPTIAEQSKIGSYFSNLDHLITLHQHKCDELKEVKRFMLQNMFPQKG